MTTPAPNTPEHLELTLDLHILNDENFAPTDDVHHHSRHHLALTAHPRSHQHFLRLGGSRSLHLTLTCPPERGRHLSIRADLHETRPAPIRARHHTLLHLTPGTTGRHHLNLHLPGDPHPYAHLTVQHTLIPPETDPETDPAAALHGRATRLGWTPDHLLSVPGGHQLATDQGSLYHHGQHVHALHAHADHQYHRHGGPAGPLGLPTSDALTTPTWTLHCARHTLRHQPETGAVLLSRLAWTHWQQAGAELGPPVTDTTRLPTPDRLEVTACQRGTLLTDPDTGARITTRTLHLPPERVTRWLQRHLNRHLPPGATATIEHPWPGHPLQYPLTLHLDDHPVLVIVPLTLRVSPPPDGRRPTSLSARQAGLIDLPAGLTSRAARRTLDALEGLFSRPMLLASLPAGHHLIGAHVTADGGLHLDFLPRTHPPLS